MKIELNTPIKVFDNEVKELTFRELAVGDLRDVRITINAEGLSLSMGDILDIAAKLANVPPSSIDQLSTLDLVTVTQAVLPLLDGLPGTGGKS